MASETDLERLLNKDVMKVNNNPLQPTAGLTLLRSAVVGGPDLEGDRRVFLDRKLLMQLAEIAASSPSQRVQVDRAGIKVDLYRESSGHTFEVWTLVGLPPKPESPNLPFGI
jgi:hypothetical protein